MDQSAYSYYYIDADKDTELHFPEDKVKLMISMMEEFVDDLPKMIDGSMSPDLKINNPPPMEVLTQKRAINCGVQVLKFDENDQPLVFDTSVLIDQFKEYTSIDVPNAYAELKKRMPRAKRSGIAYINEYANYEVSKHFHGMLKSSKSLELIDTLRTVTVIIPYKITAPIQETVSFQHLEYSKEKEKELQLDLYKLLAIEWEPDPNLPITTAKMPEPGQYLILDFNSTKCLHWVDNKFNQNEYVCFLVEGEG